MDGEADLPRRLPTGHELRAALRCGRLIDRDGVTRDELRNSYRLVPYGGLYRSEDLVRAESLLLEAGLVVLDGDVLIPINELVEIGEATEADGCEALLAMLMYHRAPLWLFAATSGEVLADELIPDDERRTLDTVLGAEKRDTLLLALGRRFSNEDQKVTGDIAERYVLDCCRAELLGVREPKLADRVRRVSLLSDQLGYDITAPRLNYSTRKLEVKGSRGESLNNAFYMSRNEAERGKVDPDWFLVMCRVSLEDDRARLVGHLSGSDLIPYLPADQASVSRWQSTRIELPEEAFTPGLPPIELCHLPVLPAHFT